MRAQHNARNTQGTGLRNKTDATVSVMSDPVRSPCAAPEPQSVELLLMQLCPAKM